ncbi:MAG TPA: IS110 family transposase [Candidatus Limnocylindria bacterium]|nr:IS110 family transposase [Candidatus Limnocylindria bacterium]
MKTAATPKQTGPVTTPALCMAIESGASEWKLYFSTGLGQHPRERTVPARRLDRLMAEVERAKKHFGLPADAAVASCYEAGRDKFWLHRALVAHGISNEVIESASIEVPRQKRRAKTDGIDGRSLLRLLWRYHNGEREALRTVRVPTEEAEDQRELHRELATTKKDRTQVVNRIRGLLAGHGVVLQKLDNLPAQLEHVRLWDGKPLARGIKDRLLREWRKVAQLTEQIREIAAERRRLLKEAKDEATECARKLMQVRAIGENAAWIFSTEFFAWRDFQNRRQVGGLAGLTGTPYQSGVVNREQGISKAGNRWVRGIVIEIAWLWLRYQPQSELSRWYERKYGHGNSRLRRIGIVALARKLLIELWRYLQTGTPPAGALLKGR